LAVSTLTYVSDTSTSSKLNEKQIETAKIKVLNLVAMYAELDEIRNAAIRKKLGMFNLNDRMLKKKEEKSKGVLVIGRGGP
jgi:hypothetical protein